MILDRPDLRKRFKYHPPKDDDVKRVHEEIRANCWHLAETIVSMTPESREQSLAITKIEEAMMWANAAIARHQGEQQ